MSELLPEGSNRMVRGIGLAIELEAVPVEETVLGSPRQGYTELATIGGCETGVWELREGSTVDVEVDEIFVVISGSATIEFPDENRAVEVAAGDVMRLAAGARTRWIVADHIRKVYIAASE